MVAAMKRTFYIPLPFGRIHETAVAVPNMGLRRWRLAIEIDWWGVALVRQLAYDKQSGPGWWTVSHLACVWVDRRWSWGDFHIYYDGPHCAWHRGFVKFGADDRDCAKCNAEGGY